jgi:hypothetical protein
LHRMEKELHAQFTVSSASRYATRACASAKGRK